MQLRHVSSDDGRSGDVPVAHVSRVRLFAWIASWIVTVCLSSVVSSHAQAATPTPDGSAAPDTTVTSSQDSKTTSRCQEYVDVLSGKKKDDAMLADPRIRSILQRSMDVVLCRAVAADSDEFCSLIPEQKDDCRILRSIFHELRTNPTGRSFMFPDAKYEICRAQLPASTCDHLRDAARSGDPNECTGAGDQEVYCRASITFNESSCEKSKEPKGCRKAIEANRVLAKGLKALAASGPPREQAFAKAALGDADACTAFAQAAVGVCSDAMAPSPINTPAVKTTAVPVPSRSAPTRP